MVRKPTGYVVTKRTLPPERTPAETFIRERIKQAAQAKTKGLWMEVLNRILIDLVRSDVPLDPGVRSALATRMEWYFFPLPPDQWRRKVRQDTASLLQDAIKCIAAGGDISTAQAKEELVTRWSGLAGSVEALEKRLQRAKRERKKADKKL
jgi:hypothetical protein